MAEGGSDKTLDPGIVMSGLDCLQRPFDSTQEGTACLVLLSLQVEEAQLFFMKTQVSTSEQGKM